MDRPRTLRRIRVAVSAMFGVLCVLLIVLWVRSYYVPYKLIRPNTAQTAAIGIISNRGRLTIGKFELGDPQLAMLNEHLLYAQFQLLNLSSNTRTRGGRQIAARQREIVSIQQQIAQYRAQLVKSTTLPRQSSAVVVPHWLLLLSTASIAAAPWIKWRFSLRTLLIATTLIAALLGLVVAFGR